MPCKLDESRFEHRTKLGGVDLLGNLAAVAKPVTKKAMESIPEAILARDKEWKNLNDSDSVWDAD